MNTYAITWRDHTETEVAETPGKAKYQFFRNHEIGDSCDFGDFVKRVKCKLSHKFHVKDLFCENIDQFNYMKEQRGIPFANLGMKVEVDGKPGVIVGYSTGCNLAVCFDGQYWSYNCHPWYRVKYFDNHGNLIMEYGD